MSRNTNRPATPDTPIAPPAAHVDKAPAAAPAPEPEAEVETIVEYVPAEDDGLTAIYEVDDDNDTEVDPDDDEWGYGAGSVDHASEDLEVSNPDAVEAAEAEAAADTEEVAK